jgi:excisionase family DNA binding protein
VEIELKIDKALASLSDTVSRIASDERVQVIVQPFVILGSDKNQNPGSDSEKASGEKSVALRRPQKPAPGLVSVSDVAAQIGVTDDTIRKWAREGKLSYVRLSKVDIRFRPEDIAEFISRRLHQAKSIFR